MRRAPHQLQRPRRWQESVTRLSWQQSPQRKRSNRLRMIVASLLTKDQGIDWRRWRPCRTR
jgi:hypothetical protein